MLLLLEGRLDVGEHFCLDGLRVIILWSLQVDHDPRADLPLKGRVLQLAQDLVGLVCLACQLLADEVGIELRLGDEKVQLTLLSLRLRGGGVIKLD